MLITAGPTREYVDPVRYLSNDSSGKMGFALASAARAMRYKVTLVAGPVALPTPRGVRRIDVVSARDMFRVVIREMKQADIVIMAAAVADWRPKKIRQRKIKRRLFKEGALLLVSTPDILAEVCRRRRLHQTVVGFALESHDIEKNARTKLRTKGCDWIIANRTESIGADTSRIVMFSRDGRRRALPRLPKFRIAQKILSILACSPSSKCPTPSVEKREEPEGGESNHRNHGKPRDHIP